MDFSKCGVKMWNIIIEHLLTNFVYTRRDANFEMLVLKATVRKLYFRASFELQMEDIDVKNDKPLISELDVKNQEEHGK